MDHYSDSKGNDGRKLMLAREYTFPQACNRLRLELAGSPRTLTVFVDVIGP
jgi:hypothetical protein